MFNRAKKQSFLRKHVPLTIVVKTLCLIDDDREKMEASG